jgi:hypothetical protein
VVGRDVWQTTPRFLNQRLSRLVHFARRRNAAERLQTGNAVDSEGF